MKWYGILAFLVLLGGLVGVVYVDAFAETLPESIKSTIHGYKINLIFSDELVSGSITSDTQTINVDNAKVIERIWGVLIIDRQNDLKIIAKSVSPEKYLVVLKINSDEVKTKFRFLTESSISEPQRNLMDEFHQSQQQKQEPDITNMSFRELQNYLKQQQVDAIVQNQREIQSTNANDNTAGKSIIDTYLEYQAIEVISVVEKEIIKSKTEQYLPKLLMSSSHDFKTYWKDIFNIDVQTYDEKINPKAIGFDGRIDNVDVSVNISKDDKIITTLTGTTQYGEWMGEYYIEDRMQSGEYTIDVLATLGDQSVSKSSSMFIIGTVSGGSSSNNDKITVAHTITLTDALTITDSEIISILNP